MELPATVIATVFQFTNALTIPAIPIFRNSAIPAIPKIPAIPEFRNQ